MDDKARTAGIANLNDSLRQGPGPGWVLSDGVTGLGREFATLAVLAVGAFDRFTPESDHSGERSSGSVHVLGRWVSWKIDYRGVGEAIRSPDPADDKATKRAIPVGLASETPMRPMR